MAMREHLAEAAQANQTVHQFHPRDRGRHAKTSRLFTATTWWITPPVMLYTLSRNRDREYFRSNQGLLAVQGGARSRGEMKFQRIARISGTFAVQFVALCF